MEIQNKEIKSLNFFNYDEDIVRVYGTPENPLFCAKDVTNILGYSNGRQAIIKNVDDEDRIRLDETRVSRIDTSKNHPHTTLINESGLYSLILRSKKPIAKKFKRWVTSEVLPSIRKSGSYHIPQQRDEKLEYMKLLTMFEKVMEGAGGMDDRDRLFVKDLAKNTLCDSRGGITEVKKANREWAVSRRLSEHFGITSKNEHKKCISFGRLMATKYRDTYGREPLIREAFVSGQVRSVKHYTEDVWEEIGDDLMMSFWNLEYEDDSE